MRPNLLILGGTTEASALCHRLAGLDLTATLSLAGRVARPRAQPVPVRQGGFGGAGGLAQYIRDARITHVIDATHPFAARISRNAVLACQKVQVPLIALTRAPWAPQDGDRWHRVPDIGQAVASLIAPRMSVFLAVGRMHLPDFAPNPQHRYLLRLVDPPEAPLPLPEAEVIVDRGPFTEAGDRALMLRHGIDVVVSKNSGGTGAVAKIHAARGLGLPVIMIDRPAVPVRTETHSSDAVLGWLGAHGADLGV